MDHELLVTGIGGQGIQLAAQLVARAAVGEGRHVMLFGSYGGMMRGGNTEAALVVGDTPVESPPTVTDAWSAIVMHPEYWEDTRRRLRSGALVVANSTVVPPEVLPAGAVMVPASHIATDVGSAGAVTMVAVGAYVRATGLVALRSLIDTLPEVLPPYRRQQVAVNEKAIRAGYGAIETLVPAWAEGAEVGA
jgi:Pyruvate/2-oxoacid:ferredoxin oxidoreductase gamma subunit